MTAVIATRGSAGADILSAQDVDILPWTGVSVESTYTHVVGNVTSCTLVLGRSGLAFNDSIFVHVGLLDSDFMGNVVRVRMFNFSDKPYKVKKGDRIAQLLVVPQSTSMHFKVKDVARKGGLGSTGKGK